jgi:hypothetical protein
VMILSSVLQMLHLRNQNGTVAQEDAKLYAPPSGLRVFCESSVCIIYALLKRHILFRESNVCLLIKARRLP